MFYDFNGSSQRNASASPPPPGGPPKKTDSVKGVFQNKTSVKFYQQSGFHSNNPAVTSGTTSVVAEQKKGLGKKQKGQDAGKGRAANFQEKTTMSTNEAPTGTESEKGSATESGGFANANIEFPLGCSGDNEDTTGVGLMNPDTNTVCHFKQVQTFTIHRIPR